MLAIFSHSLPGVYEPVLVQGLPDERDGAADLRGVHAELLPEAPAHR